MPPHVKHESRKKLIHNSKHSELRECSEQCEHLRAGGFGGALTPHPFSRSRAEPLWGFKGVMPPENSAFLILKIP